MAIEVHLTTKMGVRPTKKRQKMTKKWGRSAVFSCFFQKNGKVTVDEVLFLQKLDFRLAIFDPKK